MIALTVASPVLEYAVASFSSLVYSIHMDRGAERFAFLYYAEALKGLQAMIYKMEIGSETSSFTALAVVLQLASVEVSPRKRRFDCSA